MAASARLESDYPESHVPFVVFGDDWGRHVSTTQHIFRVLAREHPVVWLNAINHRTPKLTVYDFRRAVGKLSDMLISERGRTQRKFGTDATRGIASGSASAVAIVPPRILPWHGVRSVRRFNTRSLLRDVRAALAPHARRHRPILVSATPAIPDVVRQFDASIKIYFCLDDYAEIQGVDRSLVLPLERETLSAVDAVVATAKSLVRTKRAPAGRGYYLPQGVNNEHFERRQPLPAEMNAIPRPRIGFAGDLSLRCDLELLRGLASRHPEWSIVLVGPVNVDTSGIELPNIYILGNRPYSTLPAYVQAFDVGIIPYRLNAWTRSVDPLKTLEYLAAGIPVVSLPLPELEKYAPPVLLADGVDAFAAATASALAEPTTAVAVRQALAREHTWERRAAQFLGIVQELAVVCA